MVRKMVRLAEFLSMDHHDQGPAIMTLISIVIVFRSPAMLLAMIAYLVMHFSYGGGGTFQKPARLGKTPGIVDVFLVCVGVTGLLTYIGLALYLSYAWIMSLVIDYYGSGELKIYLFC